MADQALSGVRIVDLTQFEAGTSCTQLLGWLGADVIKVESPSGDQGRRARPWEPPDLDALFFLLFNASKRSLVIDLKHPEGRALFLRLARQADVVIENYAPGAMEKLGLDYAVLREANPAIIMARIKGYGLSGPYRDYKCFEMVAQAAGGAMSVNGFPDREPVRVGVGIGDTGTGVHTAMAILAAYIQRQRTGRGQLVEVAMQEVVSNFLRQRYMDHYRDEAFAARLGNELVDAAPADVYPCAPGGPNDYVYIYIQPAIPHMWTAFARAIGRADLLDDPEWADSSWRYRHRDELNAIVCAWTSQRSKHEVMRLLGEAGVPCSAVMDTADILNDPHLNAREAIVAIDHPTRGRYRMPGCPVRLSDSPPVITPPPLLGQHTDQVLAELLALTPAEIADLRARRVVG